jgi:hypothetical protein
MFEKVEQNLQPFVARQVFIKIAISFFSLSEIAKFTYRLIHDLNYTLGSNCFRANLIVVVAMLLTF